MEKPDISVDNLDYEPAHLEYYFNLYATNYNSSKDKISKTSQLITIKNFLDQKVEGYLSKREEKLNNLGNHYLNPLTSNEVEKPFNKFLNGFKLPSLIKNYSDLTYIQEDRINTLINTIIDLKVSDSNQFVFLKYPHTDLKCIMNKFRKDKLREHFLDIDWDFKNINSAIGGVIKFNKNVVINNVHRHGANRMLLYIFKENKINSNVPLWGELEEESQIELIEKDNDRYGYHKKNIEWIIKTFQTLKKGDYPKEEKLNNSKILDKVEDIRGHGQSDNRVAKQTELLYKYKFGYSISFTHVKRMNGLIP